jgi:hypothetical protein
MRGLIMRVAAEASEKMEATQQWPQQENEEDNFEEEEGVKECEESLPSISSVELDSELDNLTGSFLGKFNIYCLVALCLFQIFAAFLPIF